MEQADPKIQLYIDKELFEFDKRLLNISEESITNDLATHAQLFVDVAVARAKAGRWRSQATLQRDRTYNEVRRQIQKMFKLKNEKYTADDLFSYAYMHPEVQQWYNVVTEAEGAFYLLNALCEAILQRKDTMIQYNINLRREREVSDSTHA